MYKEQRDELRRLASAVKLSNGYRVEFHNEQRVEIHSWAYEIPPATILALLDRLDSLEQDAERYRKLRAEHDVDLPMCRVVWKRNNVRDSTDWGDVTDSADLDDRVDAMKGE